MLSFWSGRVIRLIGCLFQLKFETSISDCRWPRLIFRAFQTLFRPCELSDLKVQACRTQILT